MGFHLHELIPAGFVLGTTGYFAARCDILTDKSRAAIMSLVHHICLPCLAFYSIVWGLGIPYTDGTTLLTKFWFTPLMGLLLMFLGMVSATLFLPFLTATDRAKNTMLYMMIDGPSPLAFACGLLMFTSPQIGRSTELGLLFLLQTGFLFGFWLAGLYFLREDKRLSVRILRLFRLPLLAPLSACLLIAAGQTSGLPRIAMQTLRLTGASSLPLILLCMGALFHENKWLQNLPAHIMLTVVRTLCYPALAIMSLTIIYRLLDAQETMGYKPFFNALLLAILLPAGTLMAPRLRGFDECDEDFARAASVYTLLGSLIVFPLLYVFFAR